MGEVIFDKSRKNLKKVYNRLNSNNLNHYVKAVDEKVLFLAIGGYNRTYELLLKMGAEKDEIATFSNLNLSRDFLAETDGKKVIYIKKINYVTSINKNLSFTIKKLDLNVADSFEENMMVYQTAQRKIGKGKNQKEWNKPKVVILDDQSLNLQYEGHRFNYQTELGFAQIRNRNADPQLIVNEIEEVEESKKMMFALYQMDVSTEIEVLNAILRISQAVQLRISETEWALKPKDFKRLAGSQNMAAQLKEIPDLGIYQLSSNKKIGKENARWVIIPDKAFEFKGFDYKDEKDLFNEELEMEEKKEQEYIEEQEKMLNNILSIELPFNIKQGWIGKQMNSSVATLQGFLDDVDSIESEKINGLELLEGATTKQEYDMVKKNNLAYFLDGNYKNDQRSDQNYLGGRRLISIDVDDGDYEYNQIEQALESQGLFGLVYPTAKYYYDESKRWRIILMADEEMNKEQYKATVSGVAQMLGLEIDEASKKISQLMGYPLRRSDVSIVNGTMASVSQFYIEPQPKSKNVLPMTKPTKSNKTLADFDHPQAKLLKQVLSGGVEEGKRNETYYQVYMYLRDTLNNPEMELWHEQAAELIETTKQQAEADGLPEKEIEVIFR